MIIFIFTMAVVLTGLMCTAIVYKSKEEEDRLRRRANFIIGVAKIKNKKGEGK